MGYRLLKYVMMGIGALYVLLVLLVPALAPLRRSFSAWFGFFLYLLALFFVWSIGRKKKDRLKTDQDDFDTEGTQELLRDRNKWFL